MIDLRKAIPILFIILFLVMVGFGIIIPILPYLVINKQGGAIELGILMASYSIMQFFFAPLWGRWSDKNGRRKTLLIGLSGYGITFILFGLASELWMLFVIRALSGMISSATLPTAMAYIADTTTAENRAKYMGLIGAAMSLGMIFGPALGGLLGHYSVSMPFFVAGGLALLTLPVAYFLLPESLKELKSTGGKEKKDGLGIKAILASGQLPLFLLSFSVNFSISLFEGTFALFAFDRFNTGAREMGVIFSILGIVGVVVQIGLIGRLSKKYGNVKMVIGSMLFAIVGLGAMIFAPNMIWLVIFTAAFNTGTFLLRPGLSTLVTETARQGQGTSLGFMQSFDSLGRMMGPIIGGFLYSIVGWLPYVIGVSIMTLFLIIGLQSLQKVNISTD